MGILSNFIAGAAGAGGDILQRERESGVRVKESQDIARFNDELATRREQALAELRNQYQVDAEKRAVDARRAEEAYQASPERLEQLRAADLAKGKGLIANRIALAPKAAEAADAEFKAGAGTREAAHQEKLKFSLEDYRQKSAAELEAEIKKMNDPKYLQGKAREAAAGRDPNSAALHKVQLEAAQLALKEKQAEAKMPPAVKEQANAYREQLKSKSAAIDRAVADGSITPDGLKALEAQRDALSKKVEDLYRPYLGDKAPQATDAAGLDKDLAARIAALTASKGKAAPASAAPAKTSAPKTEPEEKTPMRVAFERAQAQRGGGGDTSAFERAGKGPESAEYVELVKRKVQTGQGLTPGEREVARKLGLMK